MTRVDGAFYLLDQENDIWLWDLARATLTRVTFDSGVDNYPAWTPDSRRLLFSSDRAGRNLFGQAADGTGPVEQLTDTPNVKNPTSVSPDGTRLVFTEIAPRTNESVMTLTLSGEPPSTRSAPSPGFEPGRSSASAPPQAQAVVSPSNHEVRPLIQTAFVERNGEVSPDGRWLAYEANDSGRAEIYVRPFPDVTGGRWQVSTGGGTRPLWARSGKELFYLGPSRALMSASVEGGSTFRPGNPTRLFDGPYLMTEGVPGRTYDASPDGQRFLMIKVGDGADETAAPASLIVVENWFEELKRLVPTN